MSPSVRDAAVGASVVSVGIAGLASGVLGHPAAMNLAVTVLFVLVPPFVRALERQITAQGMTKEPLTLFYRRIPWFVGVGVVVAVGSVISAKAYSNKSQEEPLLRSCRVPPSCWLVSACCVGPAAVPDAFITVVGAVALAVGGTVFLMTRGPSRPQPLNISYADIAKVQAYPVPEGRERTAAHEDVAPIGTDIATPLGGGSLLTERRVVPNINMLFQPGSWAASR